MIIAGLLLSLLSLNLKDMSNLQNPTETWKPVVGYESAYQVSNIGNVRNTKRNKNLKIWKHRTGYMLCKLYWNGKKNTLAVHRLMAIAFIPNPDNKPQVNHKNTTKHHNRLDNLEWVTNSENQIHAFANGKISRVSGSKHHASKKVIQSDLSGQKINEWESMNKAAKQLGIQNNSIYLACNNKIKKAGGFKWSFA